MAGMSPVDEELSAMLQSDHHSPAQTTLASVLAPTSSRGMALGSEHMHSTFSSHYTSLAVGFSSSAHGRQLAPVRAMNLSAVEASSNLLSQTAGVPSTSMALEQLMWPFTSDQKLELDATKNQVMKIAENSHVENSRFRPSLDAMPQGLNPPLSSRGLQRYHSAPRSLLQSLADCNKDGFSQISRPLGNTSNRDDIRGSQLVPPFFSGSNNLTSITEGILQPMETDKMLNDSTLHKYDQFFSPATKSDKRASHVTSLFAGKPDSKPADLFGKQPRLGNESLLRQSSLPADWLAALQGNIEETDPSSQMPFMTSPDESLSGGTSEDAAVGVGGKSSMYSIDDSFLLSDTTSGGLWNSQTSPVGHIGGKRLRGILDETMMDTGEGSQRDKLGGPGTLIRHTSLPANINRPTSPVLDDLADISVPCQTRAKRGCATHPRSIAERVRRTKISERMKRLQDLVPNMDKQTNMSDMLDDAVEYVKQLQKQVQDLSKTVAQLRDLQAKGVKVEVKDSSEV